MFFIVVFVLLLSAAVFLKLLFGGKSIKQQWEQLYAPTRTLFWQALLEGGFPSDDVLSLLADDRQDVPFAFYELRARVADNHPHKDNLESLRTTENHAGAVACVRHAIQICSEKRRVTTERAQAPTIPQSESEATYYELLGVVPACSDAELNSAWKGKAKQWHPDKLEGMATELSELANKKLADINGAYKQLKAKRAAVK
jgi:DnaJ-domain-containing protein 1